MFARMPESVSQLLPNTGRNYDRNITESAQCRNATAVQMDNVKARTDGISLSDDIDEYSSENLYEEIPGTKIIADPIHQTIVIDPLLVQIIDTPEFQRLRWIKQMGCADYVYPGATHTRFSHCIGVSHLAKRVGNAIKEQKLPKAVRITETDILCLQIAGLCHDLGHGAFSHLYEDMVAETSSVEGTRWSHEAMSGALTTRVLTRLCLRDSNVTPGWREHFKNENEFNMFLKRVTDMITGKSVNEMRSDEKIRAYLFQIVANRESGCDVDKWDYFSRDSTSCGLLTDGFNFDRAIRVMRVCETSSGTYEICYMAKDALNMYNMFATRFALWRKICYHRVVVGVKLMVADALKAASEDEYFNLNGYSLKHAWKSVDSFVQLTDSIMERIIFAPTEKLNENGRKAQRIITRLHNRDIYVCGLELNGYWTEEQVKTREDEIKDFLLKKLTEDQFKTDINIMRIKFNYGTGKEDPVERIKFIEKGKKPRRIPRSEVSAILPNCFQEWTLRVYCRIPDPKISDISEETLARRKMILEYLESVQ